FIGLDEWIDLSPKTEGSCQNDFHKRIFGPLGILPSQYHLFDGLSNNVEKECADMDAFIKEKGGIDLMVVGIGMNGHIGFNEPGVDFNLLSHVIDLDETTVSVGQKYFSEPVSLQKGITLGLGHLMNSKKLLLLANGKRKSMVIKKAVEETISNLFPASIIQQHPESYVLIDEDAGSLLDKSKIK
ncbi:MAG: glucosamine-6-phosphate deaminase, partial [Chitinophagaceae bacterium]